MLTAFRINRARSGAGAVDSARVAVSSLLAAALLGCDSDPAVPTEPPIAEAGITILNLQSTTPDPMSFATCQTGAGVLLEAHGSHDPAGQPLEFEWRDEVDYGDGHRLPAPDWGPTSNVIRTTEYAQPAQFSTIAYHYVTLTVRTRDGRSASQTLRVTVTSCEGCGGQ